MSDRVYGLILASLFAIGMAIGMNGCKYIEELPEADIDECPNELCGDVDNPAPVPTVLPSPEPPSNPVCTSVEDFRDGGGGVLWKPQGDHSNALVILLPSRFKRAFDSCHSDRRDGSVESLRFTGFSNADTGGLRQTWRGRSPGRAYLSQGKVVCKEFKQECVWRIPNDPSRRSD